MELEGKVGIVTGGCSGIGFAIAEAFLKEGAKIVVADYNPNGAEAIKSLNYGKDRLRFYRIDVSKEEQVESLVNFTVDTFGTLDIAVACAGIPGNGSIVDMDTERWHKILGVDLDGVYLTDKHAINAMLRLNIKGSIINMASVGGMVGFPADVSYCSAKGAVINLTRSAASMVGKNGIRVNALAPGLIETPLLKDLPPVKAAITSKEYYPMERFGKPEEVANVAVFLASDKASYVTGVTIPVDGGYTAV